jgi:hypothetical protein
MASSQEKHALECLRLAADCRTLAQSVNTPELKTHFLRMGDTWTALADQALGPKM